MTVIATDGRTMAGDGQTVCGWTISDTDAVKVHRIAGCLVGTTGNSSSGALFRAWFGKTHGIDHTNVDVPKIEDTFSALVLRPTGELDWYDGSCLRCPCSAPQAIGSGQDFALAAMDLGRSPLEAVEVACKRSMGCGGTITSLSIDGDVS